MPKKQQIWNCECHRCGHEWQYGTKGKDHHPPFCDQCPFPKFNSFLYADIEPRKELDVMEMEWDYRRDLLTYPTPPQS